MVMISTAIQCGNNFTCPDVDVEGHHIPSIEVNEKSIRVLFITEACPATTAEHYFNPKSLFFETTRLAFEKAGINVESFQDILEKSKQKMAADDIRIAYEYLNH